MNITYYNQDGGVSSRPPRRLSRSVRVRLSNWRERLAARIAKSEARVILEEDGRVRVAMAGPLRVDIIDLRNLPKP